MSAAVLWFRRDLRLGDHPALLAAAADGPVVALFVLDDLGPGDWAYRREIAWREFYAAVLRFWPDSAREYFQPAMAERGESLANYRALRGRS
jgi:deoxyribodipyrimidine photolyase